MSTYTLNAGAERVIRKLSGGDIPNDSPYDPAYVREDIRDAIFEDLQLKFLENRQGDQDDKGPIAIYIATYGPIDVSKDDATDRVYAELPGRFISMKFNKGIHSVSEMKKSLKPMIRVQTPEVTARLPHRDMEIFWYNEGLRVFWLRDIKRDGIHKVLIKLAITAPETWGADDELPILPERWAKILDIALQRTQVRYPQDRLNDNNPNLRALNEQQR